MAWTSPATWVALANLTATQLNTYVKSNLLYLKDRTQSGTGVVATIAAGRASTVVTYPVPFSSTPRVVANPITSSPEVISISVDTGGSSTSCTVWMHRTTGSGNISFCWVASLG